MYHFAPHYALTETLLEAIAKRRQRFFGTRHDGRSGDSSHYMSDRTPMFDRTLFLSFKAEYILL